MSQTNNTKSRILGPSRLKLGSSIQPTDSISTNGKSELDTVVPQTNYSPKDDIADTTEITVEEESTNLTNTEQSNFNAETPLFELSKTLNDSKVVLSDETIDSKLRDTIPTDSISCPICNENMVSLLQLNRHIDDEHSTPSPSKVSFSKVLQSSPSRSESPNDDLMSWFKKTNEVKTKIQTALPRKFVKLDIFDNNTNFGISDSSRDSSTNSLETLTPEIVVTRKHWQKPLGHDRCSYPGCKRQLSIKNGIVNCRKCGKLFCHEHTGYRVRLDALANYDHKGLWCRCCEECFKLKPGYEDFGLVHDLTKSFSTRRSKRSVERQLYENKIEKRLIKVTTTIAKIDHETKIFDFGADVLHLNNKSRRFKEAEQQIVQWENEKFVINCFICLRNFSFTLRKHHCRLCGKVVCGSELTACSMEIPIHGITEVLDGIPKVKCDIPIRICVTCKDVLFLKRNFKKDLELPPSALLSRLEDQRRVKKIILVLVPRFQELIEKLQSNKSVESKTIISDASKLRRRLLESFADFNRITKELITLESVTADEQRLQLAIRTESVIFLKKNSSPLKQLPKILEKLEPKSEQQSPKPKVNLSHTQIQEVKAMREQLMVLNEQKFLVEEMVETCRKQRKFDEIPPLTDNLNEIIKNISSLQLQLGDEGFE